MAATALYVFARSNLVAKLEHSLIESQNPEPPPQKPTKHFCGFRLGNNREHSTALQLRISSSLTVLVRSFSWSSDAAFACLPWTAWNGDETKASSLVRIFFQLAIRSETVQNLLVEFVCIAWEIPVEQLLEMMPIWVIKKMIWKFARDSASAA